MTSLAGRRAIVTGAARGIGAVVAKGLVEAGARVFCLDVRKDAGEVLIARLGDDSARFRACDVADRDQVEAGFTAALDWMGGLDVLVSAAGLDKPGFAPEDVPESAFDLVMAVDVKGTFLTNQAACRAMKGAGGGAIINFGSMAGVRGMGDRPVYSAAKAAVQGWTRAVAAAWGPHDITVNAIAPTMATEVALKYLDRLSAEERAAADAARRRTTPLGGRLGDVERDLLPLILLLAGPGGRYITGQTLAVDGGRTMLGS
jgi:NAD(P)-dependent dehydrogenase (short-subunit alcohol dehydrogenase family)